MLVTRLWVALSNKNYVCITIVVCTLLLYACTSSTSNTTPTLPQHPTYASDIAPILIKNCVPCHKKNGAGPFELLNYEQVLKHAKMIREVTRSRYMPPWPADATYSQFLDQKVLSQYDIDVISKWVEQGKPIGNTQLIATNKTIATKALQPDMVLRMKTPYKIMGTNMDSFLIMKFPFEIPEKKYVRYIEFVPDNKRVVHHVNTNLISYFPPMHNSKLMQGNYYQNTLSGNKQQVYERLAIPNDDGTYPQLQISVCNYLPGMEAYKFPDGIGGYVFQKQGMLLVDELHYGPSLKDTTDNSYFNIYFMPNAPKRPTQEITLGTNGKSAVVPPLIIQPNTVSTHSTQIIVNQDVSLLNINPHMHLLGKRFVAYAITPKGDTIPLIKINKWDFRWQYVYTFNHMLKIPKGSTIYALGTFDNTVHNLLNPFYPPRVVGERNGSMLTTDEMFQLIIMYLPYQKGDENISLKP